MTQPISHLTYSQSTGQLRLVDHTLIGMCYSGHGDGVNNPSLQYVHNVGPIPVGRYTLHHVFDKDRGGDVFRLDPDPANDMHGRSGFMIHYDTRDRKFGASSGCIIPLFNEVFFRIREGDILTVVS